MKKQDSKLALSVVATLISGIALAYTLIMFPGIIFAVAGISTVFVISAFITTQNLVALINQKSASSDQHMQSCIDQLSAQMQEMEKEKNRLEKANFLYTKQTAQTIATLEANYSESQEALYKNLAAIMSAQNKSTKLMIKYDQNNTTKVISSVKELRNQLSDTMIQGFDQIQPNNDEVVEALDGIITFLKSQPTGIDQNMGLQLNNVAHELQNISNSIQHVQVPAGNITQQPMPSYVAAEPIPTPDPTIAEEIVAPETPSIEEVLTENEAIEEQEAVTKAPIDDVTDNPAEEATEDITEDSEMSTEDLLKAMEAEFEAIETEPVEEAVEETVEEMVEETAAKTTEDSDPNKMLSADEIEALFAAADPAPKKAEKEEVAEEEVQEESFTPTFTVVGKEETEEIVEEASSDEESVPFDPNKQLSADEIAALFAAADPAPKKEEKAPEPVSVEPLSDDPNKQLSADEIAALFAAAEPAPKKEEKAPEPIKVEPISDDPNKQLSADEIAALFASLG